MSKTCIIIWSILATTLLGCSHQPISEKLDQIDSLIAKDLIDSACVIHNSLKEAAKTPEEQAHYGLLATQLGYITNHPLPSDSLLDVAFNYYNKVGNEQKLADVYYYKLRKSILDNDYPQAIKYGKEAERLAMNTDDIRLQYKIAEIMAFLNSNCENYLLTLQYGKKALALAEKAQNGNYMAYSCNIVSVAFSNLDQFDSALVYIEKSRPYIESVYDSDKAVFLMNIGLLFKERDWEKAKEYFKESLSYSEQSVTYEHLADVYYAEGKHEEAYKLYKKALVTDSKCEKDNLLHTILAYDIEHGRLDDAIENLDRLVAIKDSIIYALRNDTVKGLQLRYDHHVAINTANERLIRWQRYLGIFALIGIILLVLWLRKRHKMKTMLDKRQIEIHHLILQVDDKKNEVLKCENQIAQLKAEQQQDCQTVTELESRIEELTRQKEEAERESQMLSQKMKEWTGAEVEKIRQGALLLADLQKNVTVRHWPAEKLDAIITYYCTVNTDLVRRINKAPKKLSNKQILYLILVDMGKSLDNMSTILGVEKNSLRSYRYQINKKEK